MKAPTTNINKESTFEFLSRQQIRTMAIAATVAAQPPTACMNRANKSINISHKGATQRG
jgi:hypothetical protein